MAELYRPILLHYTDAIPYFEIVLYVISDILKQTYLRSNPFTSLLQINGVPQSLNLNVTIADINVIVTRTLSQRIVLSTDCRIQITYDGHIASIRVQRDRSSFSYSGLCEIMDKDEHEVVKKLLVNQHDTEFVHNWQTQAYGYTDILLQYSIYFSCCIKGICYVPYL